jgi:hypothetical protein
MAQFKAFAPGVEVNGQTVLSIVEGMSTFKRCALQILADCGISDPQPGRWYPQQAWLDAFETIAKSVGHATLFQIGKKIPENADWPPGIDTIEKALASIDVAYHVNHRGGEIGHYTFQVTGDRSGKMVCHNPYPCDFDRGIIETIARKFAPAGTLVLVEHADLQPCREKGADSCTYFVYW